MGSPVIVQGTRALVDPPSPLALLLSETGKVVLSDAPDAASRRAGFDWHAGGVDQRWAGLSLVRLPSL